MKKIFLLWICLVFTSAYSQPSVWINKAHRCKKQCELEDLNKMELTYIELIPRSKLISGKFQVEVDYGMRRNVFQKKIKVRTEEGKKMKYKSYAALLNYFYDTNWELVKIENTYNYHIYTMKRK